MRDYRALDTFFDDLSFDVYPEIPSELHSSITNGAIDSLAGEGLLTAGARVLDVGCGQGVALARFQALGLAATGITLGTDGAVCQARGFDVHEMDQNFMTFADAAFDLLWCRHVLEHSVMPLFTLREYHRVLKPSGLAYVEVPAPDTAAHHERNPNHYSVLPLCSWQALFLRSGFAIERCLAINLALNLGQDTYWSFLLRRPARPVEPA